MVVVEQAAETLTTLDGSAILKMLVVGHDQLIAEALMIAFGQIELSNTTPILGMSAKSAIRGIRGMAGKCGCMPVS